MKQVIKAISEAFSMQPITFRVQELGQWSKPELTIRNIEIEELVIGQDCGNPIQITHYVGYNYNNEKMFQYMCNTVNVHYI